ncbi:MAG: LptF/LptG family permease [Pirellulaceae bacterium]|nr:LptF/LptG family permease [Pirellulaceae bacterium]
MTILDRYILFLFAKVFLVCFVSLTGLYIIVDIFSNLEEFLRYGEAEGDLVSMLLRYYGARVFDFFGRTSSLLSLVAALGTITLLKRGNEFTALQAAGITKFRILVPLMGAGLIVGSLGVVNREVWLPRFQEDLSHNAQNLTGGQAKIIHADRDYKTDVFISGHRGYQDEQRIEKPQFSLPQTMENFRGVLEGANAYYQQKTDERPSGYLIKGVTRPTNISEIEEVVSDDASIVIYTPKKSSWLASDECFLVTDLSFDRLIRGSNWHLYASTAEIISRIHHSSSHFQIQARLAIHHRLVHPFVEFTFFLLGLPLIVCGGGQKFFVTAAWCGGVVILYYLLSIGFQFLGGSLLSPTLAAYGPLFVFAPLCSGFFHLLWK